LYHGGSSEDVRNDLDEALVIRPGFATPDKGKQKTKRSVAGQTSRTLPLPPPFS
jgi:hypothetical protein